MHFCWQNVLAADVGRLPRIMFPLLMYSRLSQEAGCVALLFFMWFWFLLTAHSPRCILNRIYVCNETAVVSNDYSVTSLFDKIRVPPVFPKYNNSMYFWMINCAKISCSSKMVVATKAVASSSATINTALFISNKRQLRTKEEEEEETIVVKEFINEWNEQGRWR